MKRRVLTVAAAMALIVLAAPSAFAQTGFGLRAGMLSLSSEDETITMDTSTSFGAHVALGFIPFLKLQVGAEYLKGEADYDYEGIFTLEGQDFQSIGVFLDVRKSFGFIPMFPLKVVVGGGMNLNLMQYYDEQMVMDFIGGTSSLDLENFTKTGYHLMAGLLFKPPVLPFTITAEYRLQTIKLEGDTLKNNGIVIGLTFGF